MKGDTIDPVIALVRQAMTDADVGRPAVSGRSLAVGLRTLRGRLGRLQSLGGAYAAVAASEHLEELFRRVEPDRSVA